MLTFPLKSAMIHYILKTAAKGAINKLNYFQNSLYFLPQYYHVKESSMEMSNLNMDALHFSLQCLRLLKDKHASSCLQTCVLN